MIFSTSGTVSLSKRKLCIQLLSLIWYYRFDSHDIVTGTLDNPIRIGSSGSRRLSLCQLVNGLPKSHMSLETFHIFVKDIYACRSYNRWTCCRVSRDNSQRSWQFRPGKERRMASG